MGRTCFAKMYSSFKLIIFFRDHLESKQIPRLLGTAKGESPEKFRAFACQAMRSRAKSSRVEELSVWVKARKM